MNYFVSIEDEHHIVISTDEEIPGFRKMTDKEITDAGLLYSDEEKIDELDPQLKALLDRQSFLEDCIAEMAQVVYS